MSGGEEECRYNVHKGNILESGYLKDQKGDINVALKEILRIFLTEMAPVVGSVFACFGDH
jgi:hypothetical protein